MRKLITAAAAIAAVFTVTAPAHATDCTDVTIDIGQPYWLFNGSPFVKANGVPTPLQLGQRVVLGTFAVPNGVYESTAVNNTRSQRTGTTAHVGTADLFDVEASHGWTTGPGVTVTDNTLTIAVTLGPDPRQSIDQVRLTCPSPPDTTSTTSTTSSVPAESSTTTLPVPTTTVVESTSTSSPPSSSTSSTSSVPAGTTTTSSTPDGTTTTAAPSSTGTIVPESSTTKAPSSSHPSTTVQPTLPPTGPGDFVLWLMWVGAVCIVAGVWLVRRAS